MRALRWLLLASAVLSFTACGGGSNAFHKAQCNDGKDNDGDGVIDFPDDPGCTSAEDDSENSQPSPQCKDGRDNDGDGKIDFPDDPGCYAPNQNDETDDCPDGPDCPQCSNGKDDDGNGQTDYPQDMGCSSAADNDEYPSNPQACGAAVKILSLPPGGAIDGILTSMMPSSLSSAMCGGTAGTEDVYELRIHEATVVVATTDMPGTSADTVVYIRSAQCAQPSSELGCSAGAGISAAADPRAVLTQSIAMPGTYYLVVDDQTGEGGSYQLQVMTYPGEGIACTADECGPGLVCRVPMGQTDKVCSKPVCSDGVDDDGDGKADYPDDPGCVAPSDNDESDNCPSGAGCPKCSNNIDDDSDGKKDYPLDPSCSSAASNGEVCHTAAAVGEIVGPTTLGDTTSASDDYNGACSGSGNMAPDLTYEITVPKLTSFTYQAKDPSDSFFPYTALLGATCGGTEVACTSSFDDPTSKPLAAGTYYIVVDGDYSGDVGPFELNVSGTIAAGQSCESPLAVSGALTCAPGYVCGGTLGSRTCVPSQCNDGVDNNHDGKTDYPNDPGCASPSDNAEDTVCPGAMCPVCSNGSDDDTDMKTDFPADFGCSSAAGTAETFCPTETDPAAVIAAATTSGTLASLHADLGLSCNSFSDGNDKTYALQLPVAVESLTIDTTGSTITDTILQMWDTQCGTSIMCNDDSGSNYLSSFTVTDVAAGNYAVTVKAYDSTYNGAFKLNVKGTVSKGTACTGALFTAGVLKCKTGTTCTAGVCK